MWQQRIEPIFGDRGGDGQRRAFGPQARPRHLAPDLFDDFIGRGRFAHQVEDTGALRRREQRLLEGQRNVFDIDQARGTGVADGERLGAGSRATCQAGAGADAGLSPRTVDHEGPEADAGDAVLAPVGARRALHRQLEGAVVARGLGMIRVLRAIDAGRAGIDDLAKALGMHGFEDVQRADEVDLGAAHRVRAALRREHAGKVDHAIAAAQRAMDVIAIPDIADEPVQFIGGLARDLRDGAAVLVHIEHPRRDTAAQQAPDNPRAEETAAA